MCYINLLSKIAIDSLNKATEIAFSLLKDFLKELSEFGHDEKGMGIRV